jgi:hypothetical protein
MKLKSPRTPHLIGSGLRPGDDHIDFQDIVGKHVVLEEKVDGSETSFHFDEDLNLVVRERANALDINKRGGAEKHFDTLKDFLLIMQDDLYDVIDTRYLVYGMWCLAVHEIEYDRLPHYFLEFDVQDKSTSEFLSTKHRKELLAPLQLKSVAILYEGLAHADKHPSSFVGASNYGPSMMEGVYGKVEDDDFVTGRFKWIRPEFIQSIIDRGQHWKAAGLRKNRIADEPLK